MTTKIQVNQPSPCCGSFYRTVNETGQQRCNLCGEKCETCRDVPDVTFIKNTTGRRWSKAKHRFLREGEA